MVKSEQKIQSSKAMSSSSTSTSSWGSISSPQQQSPPQSSSCYKKKFKGVRMRSWGSWVSEIRAPNQKTRIWLGSYSTPEAAARAYDAALVCLKGSSANLNFPIDDLHIPIPIPNPDSIMSPKSIQRVAAAAAAAAATNPDPPPPTSSPSLSHSADLIPISTSSMADAFPIDEPELPDYCWFDDLDNAFQSPKYLIDPDFSSSFFFNPPNMIIDYEDPADIPLWSFC